MAKAAGIDVIRFANAPAKKIKAALIFSGFSFQRDSVVVWLHLFCIKAQL
jgi:hypothetical protein